MRFASLGSGSKGNGTLVMAGSALLLVDCGFSARETEQRLARLGLTATDLSAILVTHEHGDHVRGVGALARRYRLPVYASPGTFIGMDSGRHGVEHCACEEVVPGRVFSVAGVDCLGVSVPHDARQPCQYVFAHGGRSLGVLTDLGSITPTVVEAFGDCDGLMLECNHDPDLLMQGPYPPALKRRVGGAYGHLSNQQAAALLAQCNVDRLQHLVLSHLSEQNNTPTHASNSVAAVVEQGQERIRVASQGSGFDWLELV